MRYVIFPICLFLAGCMSIAGDRLPSIYEPKKLTGISIDVISPSEQKWSYVESIVSDQLSSYYPSADAISVAERCRYSVEVLTVSRVSPVEYGLYYVINLASLATLSLIPGYSRVVHSTNIAVLDDGKTIEDFSLKESEHKMIWFFAGFIGPENEYFPSNVEEEIARKLSANAIVHINKLPIVRECTSNPSLKADRPDGRRP